MDDFWDSPQGNIEDIPASVFQKNPLSNMTDDEYDAYEEMNVAFEKAEKVSHTALVLGITAVCLYGGSYILNCCCCCGNLLQFASFIVSIVGAIYGIIGIVRSKEFGVNKQAIIGLVLSVLPLLLFTFGMIVTIIYYGISSLGAAIDSGFNPLLDGFDLFEEIIDELF